MNTFRARTTKNSSRPLKSCPIGHAPLHTVSVAPAPCCSTRAWSMEHGFRAASIGSSASSVTGPPAVGAILGMEAKTSCSNAEGGLRVHKLRMCVAMTTLQSAHAALHRIRTKICPTITRRKRVACVVKSNSTRACVATNQGVYMTLIKLSTFNIFKYHNRNRFQRTCHLTQVSAPARRQMQQALREPDNQNPCL